MSCCVAGNQSLAAPEGDLLETLQLLSDRAGLPPPAAASTADGVGPLPFYDGPRGILHRISYVFEAAPNRTTPIENLTPCCVPPTAHLGLLDGCSYAWVVIFSLPLLLQCKLPSSLQDERMAGG